MNKFIPVKLEFLVKDEFFNTDLYLKIGSEFIKYVHKNEDNKDQLLTLLNKNCKEVFLDPNAATEYMIFKRQLLSKELTKDKNTSECLSQFKNNYQLLKDFFVGVSQDQAKTEYIQELGRQASQILEKNDSLSVLYNNFKKEQPDQLIIKELVAFFSLFSLKYFDHIPTDQLEKFNVAILLTDILLEPEEVPKTYVDYSVNMPKEILNHPINVLNKVPKETYFETSTIINLIKNHHEKPDGLGYPSRLSYTRFDIFLCTYYIAEQLVLNMIKKDLKLNEIAAVYSEIHLAHKKYSTPNFNRAFENFDKLINRIYK